MTFKNFVCKGILVFAGLLLLGWIGKYIYMVDGEIGIYPVSLEWLLCA